jgi:hypothetical protein
MEVVMAGTGRKPRPPIAARRFGYLIAAAINGVFLYLINVSPGWQAVSFLTDDTSRVLGLVNFSILANIAANLLYVIYDARWWKATGDLVTTGIGLIVMTRIWNVFPFDFSDSAFDWTFLARLLLVIGMVGATIGMVVQLVLLVRLAGGRDDDRSEKRVGSGV